MKQIIDGEDNQLRKLKMKQYGGRQKNSRQRGIYRDLNENAGNMRGSDKQTPMDLATIDLLDLSNVDQAEVNHATLNLMRLVSCQIGVWKPIG